MKKTIGSIILVGIVVLSVFLLRREHHSSGPHHATMKISGRQVFVGKFESSPPWQFDTYNEFPVKNLDRWKKLVLISQTDYMKFLVNSELIDVYGRAKIEDEDLDAQRDSVVSRFALQRYSLTVQAVYLVLDPMAKTCHLLIPIDNEQGQYFSSIERISGTWKLIPGENSPPWVVSESEKIISSINLAITNGSIQPGSFSEMDSVATDLAANYISRK